MATGGVSYYKPMPYQANHSSTALYRRGWLIGRICLQYRKLADLGGPLSKLETIPFTLNTDGVGPLFHSTQFSIWPLYLMINEFPYQMRFAYDFV